MVGERKQSFMGLPKGKVQCYSVIGVIVWKRRAIQLSNAGGNGEIGIKLGITTEGTPFRYEL